MFKFLVFASLSFLVAQSALSSPSSSSVKNLRDFAPFEKMEAEAYSEASGSAEYGTCGVNELGYTNAGHYAAYFGVDFEDVAEMVTFRVRGGRHDFLVGYIELRLGSATSERAAVIPVSATGNNPNCNYVNLTSFLPAVISGVQDLYLTFDSSTGEGVVGIDWFQFTKNYDVGSSS